MAYDFHYTPTGTGVISGKEVLEQTEDAINDLGNTAISGVQEALDKAEQALTNSENAVDDAQTALNTANNAEGVAIQAQTDVGNLSGTVTNIGNRVTTAEGNISNLQGRMTTAEGNISNLQGRMTTAETNIGNLQTAVSTAQATANSAQQTATTARQQSYVFRYSSTVLTPSSTNSNTLLDNTDNLKVGDKVIDSSGVLFSITAIDTANSTFTIGTALIDLAQDSDVVHKSGNETITGEKNFQNTSTDYSGIKLEGSRVCYITADNANDSVFPSSACGFSLLLPDVNKAIHIGQWTSSNNRIFLNKYYPYMSFNGSILRSNTYVPTGETNTATLRLMAQLNYADDTNKNVDIRLVQYDSTASSLYSNTDNVTSLGVASRRWSKIYGTEYYYGSNNVEFSTKFVTTDTAQTISGAKTFTNEIINNITNKAHASITLKNSSYDPKTNGQSSANLSSFSIAFTTLTDDGFAYISAYGLAEYSLLRLTTTYFTDSQNSITDSIEYRIYQNGDRSLRPRNHNNCTLGETGKRWKDVQTNLINGLTPSSLSLPSTTGVVDISSYITDLTGTANTYTVLANGYIQFDVTGSSVEIDVTNGLSQKWIMTDPKGFIPVISGASVSIKVVGTAINNFKFIPCQGNV